MPIYIAVYVSRALACKSNIYTVYISGNFQGINFKNFAGTGSIREI